MFFYVCANGYICAYVDEGDGNGCKANEMQKKWHKMKNNWVSERLFSNDEFS